MTTEPEPDVIGSVWVRTVPHPLNPGVYEPVLEVGEDFSIVLTTELAHRYIDMLMAAITSAQYQAGIVSQMREIGADNRDIAAMLLALRVNMKDRQRVVEQIPLTFEGRVTIESKAFLVVEQTGQPLGKWGLAEAQSHALGILEVLNVAPLDTFYHSLLIGQIELTTELADRVVERLADHLPDQRGR